jgi:hypothetical protein
MTNSLRLLTLLGLLTLGIACASDPPPAKPLVVGARLASATLLDQNEVAHRIDESIHIILFAREMEGGAVIRALLDAEGPKYLTKHRALYVADISDMPALVARLAAIPRMRKRAYPTLLDREGTITAPFPAHEGRVTVMGLDKLRVTAIYYRGSVAGVREAVAKIR